MDRDRRLTGYLRGQTDNPRAPPGFELNNPWRVRAQVRQRRQRGPEAYVRRLGRATVSIKPQRREPSYCSRASVEDHPKGMARRPPPGAAFVFPPLFGTPAVYQILDLYLRAILVQTLEERASLTDLLARHVPAALAIPQNLPTGRLRGPVTTPERQIPRLVVSVLLSL